MFKGDKFRTLGIEENISLEIQLFMWSAVENMPEPKDCFQVFELKSENGLQVIHHYSEQPVFDMTYILPTIEKPVNAKVYIIDDYYSDEDKHIATMLLAEEY